MAMIGVSASAESTVYVFIKSVGNTDVQILVDGKQVCDLNGPEKKRTTYGLEIPLVLAKSCYRKLTFSSESKIVLSAKMHFVNAYNRNETDYKAEIPLDLEDGETYYVELGRKGMKDCQMKQHEEKKVKKWLKDWVELPAVNVE